MEVVEMDNELCEIVEIPEKGLETPTPEEIEANEDAQVEEIKLGDDGLTDEERTRVKEVEAAVVADSALGKLLDFEVKQDKEDPSVLHFVSSTEDVDRDGDIIRVAGWDLKNYRKNPIFLWMHDAFSTPIGRATKVIKNLQDKTLEFLIKFVEPETLPFADTVRRLYLGKFLHGTSVRFRPIKINIPKDEEERDALEMPRGGIEFKKQELLENSAVTLPANPETRRLSLAKMLGLGVFSSKDMEVLDIAAKDGGVDEVIEGLKKDFDEIRRIVVVEKKVEIPPDGVLVEVQMTTAFADLPVEEKAEKIKGQINVVLGIEETKDEDVEAAIFKRVDSALHSEETGGSPDDSRKSEESKSDADMYAEIFKGVEAALPS